MSPATDIAESTEDPNDDVTAKPHQLKEVSLQQDTVGNVLKNSSFENGIEGWTKNHTYISLDPETDKAYRGSKSLKVVCSADELDVPVYGPSFVAEAGKSYTFSAYVQTENTEVTVGLGVPGMWSTSSGRYVPKNKGWTKVQINYTNNSGAAVTVNPILISRYEGTYYVDCVQVEEALTAGRYNLLENGDFRHAGSPTYGWTGTGLASGDGIVSGTAAAPQLSTNYFKITGSPMVQKHLSQTVNISGEEKDMFVFGGWAKANAVPKDAGRVFGISAAIHYADNTTQTATVFFNPGVTDWQYAAGGLVAAKDYTAITVTLMYDGNVNTAYFDGIQLYKEGFGTSYKYDGSGNLTKATNEQNQITEYVYNNNNGMLITEKQPNDKVITYTYDTYFNITRTVIADETGNDADLVYTYSYDTYGNNTQTSLSNGSKPVTTSATYANSGNTLASTTDALGKTTTYSYNANTNVLEWVQNPEDTAATRTNYTYDSMYRLVDTTVTTDSGLTMSADYTYANDRLTQLQTGSSTYTFDYNGFAQRTKVMVGTRTLATYSYTNDQNRQLSRLDYGNQDRVQYTYDEKGRLVKETYEDGATVKYRYDVSGVLSIVVDSESGLTTTQFNDFAERTVTFEERGNIYDHSIGYGYDARYNMTVLVETINNVEHRTGYSYTEDDLPFKVQYGVSTRENFYDDFDRVDEIVTGHNGALVFRSTLDYHQSSTTTSNLLRSYHMAINGRNISNTYYYDDNGNVIEIQGFDFTGKGYNKTYAYDSANQLVRENNNRTGKTIVWTYDDAGNILSRTEYAYTAPSQTPTNPTKTVLYGYGDSQWGDLLTSYDGRSFSYDTIGNLTNDGIWTYTWKHGRELASMSNGSTTWTYTYNADGLRVKKTNGTTSYVYVYNDGLLSQMTVGSNTLYITYDANGLPFTVNYNGNVYYYVLNAFGDVIGFTNQYGTVVTEYTYDAWGNLLTCSGTLCNSLGRQNPLRYRSYIYDEETGLYYLQSRYYNPEIGRFINADSLLSQGAIQGNNMFAYCLNNPVNMADTTGQLPFFLVTAAIGAVIGGAIGGVVAAKNGGNVWAGIGIGAAAGALIGTGAGMGAGAALAGSITATTGAVMAGGSTLVATVGTGGFGAGATYIANNLSQAANSLAPVAQTAASKMRDVATKGKVGEALSGLTKNTARIPSLTGTASYRIPDGLDAGMKILSEVKNYSGTLSYTNQLKDFVMWSQANGYQMHLYTNATLTGPLQQVVDSGVIQLFPLG